MKKLLIGTKIGMTQVYDEKGVAHPVTVIQAGPCTVTQLKTQDTDGYTAVQLAFGSRNKIAKPVAGHLKKSGVETAAVLRELRLEDQTDYQVGQQLDTGIFSVGETVTITATSKGKGYAGVVKRHGFAGGPGSHGSDFHRAPGAIGGRWPQRVTKGRRMAGHMGNAQVTVKGLRIHHIDAAANLIAVTGAIPGPRRGVVEIRG